MKELKRIKEVDIYEPLFDLTFNDKLIIGRSYENLVAFSPDFFEENWSVRINGEHRMGIDFIFTTKDEYLLIFSYRKTEKNFLITLLNKNGQEKWNSISQSRPKFGESLVEKDGFIFFSGYKIEGGKGGIYSIEISTGSLGLIVELDIKPKIVTLAKDTLIIVGSNAIVRYNDLSGITPIMDGVYISYSTKIKDSILSLAQSEMQGKYHVLKQDLDGNNSLAVENCGLLDLDDTDRQYMEPFAYDDNTLIIFNGKQKGISCYSLSEKKIQWSSGQNLWTCLDVVSIDEKLVVHAEDKEDEALILVYDLNGKCIQRLETDVYPEIIHSLENFVFVSSYDGLEIFEFA